MPSTEIVIVAFLGLALLASVISSKTRTPYTLLLVLLGMLLATSSASSILGVDLIYSQLVGGGLFVVLVLPPLLFETMMNIRVEAFTSVSRPALLLATLGVVVATLVGGVLLWRLAGIPIYPAFLFAALIAPTDVATVLEIFKRVGVPEKLATLLETEAVFNDATGILVFASILASFNSSGPSLAAASADFLLRFGGGLLVGLAVAMGASMLHRLVSERMSDLILTIATVYGSYAIAGAIGASGLIAVAVTGLYYGNTVISREVDVAAQFVKDFWKVLAYIANTLAFLVIGLSTNVGQLLGGLGAIAVAYVAVTAARYVSVQAILGLQSIGGEKFESSWRSVALLGGMRGALSVVLVASVPTTVPARELIVTMTLGVAFLSIVLQGPLLTRYASRVFRGR
ncbi:MAG TPA: sodium:proton antiporter [Nitrososphaerales archaeon]|nr:sodium:proton antiporter [Nitrososphaerales archaeon]